MKTSNTIRIWIGLLTLPLSALLAIIALLVLGPGFNPVTHPTEWAELATSARYLVSQITLVAAYIVPFYGYWALYRILAGDPRTDRLAFLGMWGGIWGTALALPAFGIQLGMAPIAARRSLQGAEAMGEMVSQAIVGPSLWVGAVALLLYTVGPILLGIALWRAGSTVRWAAVLFAAHGLFYGLPGMPMKLVANILLGLSSGWIAFRFWKQMAGAQT